MFAAAFVSLSWLEPQPLHIQSLTPQFLSPLGPVFDRQTEQVTVENLSLISCISPECLSEAILFRRFLVEASLTLKL